MISLGIVFQSLWTNLPLACVQAKVRFVGNTYTILLRFPPTRWTGADTYRRTRDRFRMAYLDSIFPRQRQNVE
ncbi:hypothetical protein LshimejAT787_0209200 [Lyophyllum shimeji]|uniref:Secreted protein n=1 Tax=Lyophyllum shimeji TaxID=47721 RepID=A0A9P3PG08_LYOSH|nr:hypothetical protein LshimejAT787_0209200 [Lyophyllum shimeji]